MFNNCINRHDFFTLCRRLGNGSLMARLRRMLLPDTEKTIATWAPERQSDVSWWSIPRVRQRWNLLVSGRPEIDPPQFLCEKYLAGRRDLRALSLACGSGQNELRWGSLGCFSRIDGWDLSAARIRLAEETAQRAGLGEILRFRAGDAFAVPENAEAYDAVLAIGALHHFSPLAAMLDKIGQWLRPDGFLFLMDFVGPTRFQWTDRQLALTNAVLSALPEKYRRLPDGGLKLPVYRPSLFRMRMTDPSEAVESGSILPLVSEKFEVLETRPYGGTILHLLLDGIAGNFLDESEETIAALEFCFSAEDLAMRSGEVGSDYMVAACRKRALIASGSVRRGVGP